jgi:transcriptional regulator with XRE-family HTH domain
MEVYHLCLGGRRGCIRPRHLDIAPAGSRIKHVPDPKLSIAERDQFKDRLLLERQARGSSMPEMASELGVSQATYREWEKGGSAPVQSIYDEISRKLGWDGLMRRFSVLVAVERIVAARSAGDAAAQVLEGLTEEGAPLKAKIIRATVKI